MIGLKDRQGNKRDANTEKTGSGLCTWKRSREHSRGRVGGLVVAGCYGGLDGSGQWEKRRDGSCCNQAITASAITTGSSTMYHQAPAELLAAGVGTHAMPIERCGFPLWKMGQTCDFSILHGNSRNLAVQSEGYCHLRVPDRVPSGTGYRQTGGDPALPWRLLWAGMRGCNLARVMTSCHACTLALPRPISRPESQFHHTLPVSAFCCPWSPEARPLNRIQDSWC